MSKLTPNFNSAQDAGTPEPAPAKKPKHKRLAPFSIRLSETDRARLALEAAGAPLGAYIKSKLLDGKPDKHAWLRR